MDLAPIQRAVTPIELTAPSSRLESHLASWRSPQFLGELGHQVSAASGGLAEGIAVAAPGDAEVPAVPEPSVRTDFPRPAVVPPTQVTVARSLTTATDRVPDAAARRLEVAAPSVQRAGGFDVPHPVGPGPAEAAPGLVEAATAGPAEVQPEIEPGPGPAKVEPKPVTRRLGLGPPITTLTPPDEPASSPPAGLGPSWSSVGQSPSVGRGATSLPGGGASPSPGASGLQVSRAAESAVPASSTGGSPTSGPRPPRVVASRQDSTTSAPSSGTQGPPSTPPPPAPRPGSSDVSVQASRGASGATPPQAGPPGPGVEDGGSEAGRPVLRPLVGRTTVGPSIEPPASTGDPGRSDLATPGVGEPPLVPLLPLQASSGGAPDLPPAPATPESPAALLGERVLPLLTQAGGTAPDDGLPAPSPEPAARVQRWLAPDLPQAAGPVGRTVGSTASGASSGIQRRTASSTADPRAAHSAGPLQRDFGGLRSMLPAVPKSLPALPKGLPALPKGLPALPKSLPGPSQAADALRAASAAAERLSGTDPASAAMSALPVATPPGLDDAVADAVRSGVAAIDPDGSLRFAPPTDASGSEGGPAAQQEAGEAAVAEATEAAAAIAGGTATRVTTGSSASAPTPGAPGHPGTGPGDLDDLARRLYERIRARLRAELRLDMERAGMLTRPGR